MHELGRVGLIAPFDSLASSSMLRSIVPSPTPSFEQIAATPDDGSSTRQSFLLYSVAEGCEGFSGRALRKLPFLAHALFGGGADGAGQLPIDTYLLALRQAVEHERGARSAMGLSLIHI